MSRQQETVVTFNLRLKLPKGGNAASAQQYIRDAVISYRGGLRKEDPYFNLTSEDYTVVMVKKETTYA